MVPERTSIILDRARGVFPLTRESSAGLGSFTRRRIERIIWIVVSVGSLALGAQAFLAAFGPREYVQDQPHLVVAIVVFSSLAAMVVACAVGRGVAVMAGIFIVVYVLTLLLWPFVAVGGVVDSDAEPWIWYLVTVATASSIFVFPYRSQLVFTLGLSLLYGIERVIQEGLAEVDWVSLVFDVSFAVVLGGILVVIVHIFRRAASDLDESRSRAVKSYASAASSDAAERERIAVAALMHDSVLAALIAAERASTPRERTLAVAMAREALTRLANTEQGLEEGSDAPCEPASIADEIERSALELGTTLDVLREIDTVAPAVPGRVARALLLAATQAISNAITHADGVGLAVVVRGDRDHIEITVRDKGKGFDLDAVPRDRLGIRASIFARVAAVGGKCEIVSDAQGTIVHLDWAGALR